jgi:hypothetical protein
MRDATVPPETPPLKLNMDVDFVMLKDGHSSCSFLSEEYKVRSLEYQLTSKADWAKYHSRWDRVVPTAGNNDRSCLGRKVVVALDELSDPVSFSSDIDIMFARLDTCSTFVSFSFC